MNLNAYSDEELMQIAGSKPPVGGYSDYSDEELMQMAGQKPPSGATRSLDDESLTGYLSETVKNIPSDAWRLTKDIAGMIVHPLDTLRGARDIIAGAGQTAARDIFGSASSPDFSSEEQAFLGIMNPVSESIMEPGGVPSRVKEFVKERPVTSLFNASLLTGGVAKTAEAAGMARTAAAIGKVAEVTNPVLQATRAAVRTVKTVVPSIGRVVKESLGAYTGRGPGFVEEMVKGAEAAENAMRGGLTGEEVVAHAREGLQKLRDMRSEEYVAKLENVRTNPGQLNAVAIDLNKTVGKLVSPDKFDIGLSYDKAGGLQVDFSKSTIVEHQAVVRRALEDIVGWKDGTAAGFDTLKKRLSTYITQTGRDTPAKAFVTQLEKNLSGGLKRAVPGYEAMTKGYREASNLIKDIESNLMLRKEGMTGRITADQTLRRLSSALRENFEMRKDLLRALGNESGMDIPAEVAGYLAQQWLPAGMIGKGLATANAYMGLVNPKMWPILAASSPRVVGEFLNAVGKASNAVRGGVRKAAKLAEQLKNKVVGSGDFPSGPTGAPAIIPPEIMPGGEPPPRPPDQWTTQDAVYENSGLLPNGQLALPEGQRLLPPPGPRPNLSDMPERIPPRPGTEIAQPGAATGGKQPLRYDPSVNRHNGEKLTPGDILKDNEGNTYRLDRDNGFMLTVDQVNKKGESIGIKSFSVDPMDKTRYRELYKTGENAFDSLEHIAGVKPSVLKDYPELSKELKSGMTAREARELFKKKY